MEPSCFEGPELLYRIGGSESGGDEGDMETCDELFLLAGNGDTAGALDPSESCGEKWPDV